MYTQTVSLNNDFYHIVNVYHFDGTSETNSM